MEQARRRRPWETTGVADRSTATKPVWQAASLTILLLAPQAALAGETSLFEVVRRYADAMIEKGRDTYGPQQTGLFLSALDRSTMAPLTTRPAASVGIREGDRAGPRNGPLIGANPQHDQDLLRVLYALSSMTGDARYRQAADQEIQWFFQHARSPATDLLPWGEHLSWNVMADEPASGMLTAIHEFAGPWLLWDRSYALAPDDCYKFALGVWNHQIADPSDGSFDRHARFREHGIQKGMEFARHGGFFIRTWAEAYAHTGDETFTRAIEKVLGLFEKRRHRDTGLIDQCCRRRFAVMSQTLSMAIDCEAASGLVPAPLADRLRRFAAREDEVFCSLPHDPKGKGFLNRLDRATRQPFAPRGETAFTPPWETHYGGIPTATIAGMCATRYQPTRKPHYLQLLLDAAEGYLTSLPDPSVDVRPGAFAQVIATELAAFRWTGRAEFLKRAEELARLSVETFWLDGPLPRASLKTQHYETITGAGSLALVLLQVHAAAHPASASLPAELTGR